MRQVHYRSRSRSAGFSCRTRSIQPASTFASRRGVSLRTFGSFGLSGLGFPKEGWCILFAGALWHREFEWKNPLFWARCNHEVWDGVRKLHTMLWYQITGTQHQLTDNGFQLVVDRLGSSYPLYSHTSACKYRRCMRSLSILPISWCPLLISW